MTVGEMAAGAAHEMNNPLAVISRALAVTGRSARRTPSTRPPPT